MPTAVMSGAIGSKVSTTTGSVLTAPPTSLLPTLNTLLNPSSMSGIFFVMYCTISRISGSNSSARDIFIPSTALSKRTKSPCKLSCIVLLMSEAAPSQFFIAAESFSTSAGAAFISESQLAIASSPAIFLPYVVCSSSVNPCHASRVSAITSPKSRALPFVS